MDCLCLHDVVFLVFGIYLFMCWSPLLLWTNSVVISHLKDVDNRDIWYENFSTNMTLLVMGKFPLCAFSTIKYIYEMNMKFFRRIERSTLFHAGIIVGRDSTFKVILPLAPATQMRMSRGDRKPMQSTGAEANLIAVDVLWII